MPNITKLVPHSAGLKNKHLWHLHLRSFKYTSLGTCRQPQTFEDHVVTADDVTPALCLSHEQSDKAEAAVVLTLAGHERERHADSK